MSHGNHSHHHHHDALDSQGTSLSPLFPHLHRGLIAVTVLAITSFVASSALFAYLTTKLLQRYVFGPKPQPADPTTASQSSTSNKQDDDFRLGIDGIFTDSGSSNSQGEALVRQKSIGGSASASSASQIIVAPNQSLILIYNLVVADIIQSSAFALNLSWLVQDGIFIQTATCFTQGLLISLGDLSSSVFITSIAAHAFFSIVKGYQPRHCVLYLVIACLWSFIFVVSLVPIAVTHNGVDEGGYFVRAVAWCWISEQYQAIRLATHYVFLFIGIASTSAIYIAIFIHLRRSPTSVASHAFLLYPIIYVVCTLPIAIGRILNMANIRLPVEYFCFAGALIAFNGFLDCVLYGFTRNSILFAPTDDMGRQDTGVKTFTFLTPPTKQFGNLVSVQAGDKRKRKADERKMAGMWSWQRIGGRPDMGAPDTIHMDLVTSVTIERRTDLDGHPTDQPQQAQQARQPPG